MRNRADTENAHIRKEGHESPEQLASEATRALEDPAVVRAFEDARNQIIREIETLPIYMEEQGFDADQMERIERELCRTLRSLEGAKRALSVRSQFGQMRLVMAEGNEAS